MVRYSFSFYVGKHLRDGKDRVEKIGTSLEDCWDKLLRSYRKAQHSPIEEKWKRSGRYPDLNLDSMLELA